MKTKNLAVSAAIGLLFLNAGKAVGQDKIETNAEYLEAIKKVMAEYHGGSGYMGSRYVWKCLEAKANALLDVDERAGDGVWLNLRNVLMVAVMGDVAALAITDSKTAPITGKKVSPVKSLPELLERLQKCPGNKGQDVEGFIGRIVNPRLSAWHRYRDFVVKFNQHENWEEILKLLVERDPEVKPFLEEWERSDPYWRFHNLAVGFLPDMSDTYPKIGQDIKKKVREKLIATIGEGGLKIRLNRQEGELDFSCQIGFDPRKPTHMLVEADTGAFGASMFRFRATWDSASGSDPIYHGRVTEQVGSRGTSFLFGVYKMNMPGSDEFTAPASGHVYLWQGDEKMPEGLRERNVDYIVE